MWRYRGDGWRSLRGRVISSIHGNDGAFGRGRASSSRAGRGGVGVWNNIIKAGRVLDELGVEVTSSICKNVRNGEITSFWDDKWLEGIRLKDKFPRPYVLEKVKGVSSCDRGPWVNDVWPWLSDLDGPLRGRG